MSDQSKSFRALYGIQARSDYLTYIINLTEATARQRLLDIEEQEFQNHPCTREERRLFRLHVEGERRQIRNARAEVAGSLDDVTMLGEDYVDGMQGSRKKVPEPGSVEYDRHVPTLDFPTQLSIWDMVTEAPEPEEVGAMGTVSRDLAFTSIAEQHANGYKPGFAAAELTQLIVDGLRRSRTRRPEVAWRTRRRSPSPSSASIVSDSAFNDFGNLLLQDGEPTEEQLDAWMDALNELLKISPFAPMSETNRQRRRVAMQIDTILAMVQDLLRDVNEEGDDEETRIKRREDALQQVLEETGFYKLQDEERKTSEAAVGKGKGKAPAEGEAGSSTGPGTTAGTEREKAASPTSPHAASVEEGEDSSPDPSMVALPDSDSAYGSTSSAEAEQAAWE